MKLDTEKIEDFELSGQYGQAYIFVLMLTLTNRYN